MLVSPSGNYQLAFGQYRNRHQWTRCRYRLLEISYRRLARPWHGRRMRVPQARRVGLCGSLLPLPIVVTGASGESPQRPLSRRLKPQGIRAGRPRSGLTGRGSWDSLQRRIAHVALGPKLASRDARSASIFALSSVSSRAAAASGEMSWRSDLCSIHNA
jgi:hypothetical protein